MQNTNFVKYMKKLNFVFALALLLPLFATSQTLNVLYSFRTYYSSNSNYAEITTAIDANTAKIEEIKSGLWAGKLELTTIICPVSNSDSAIYIDKRVIKSPEVKDKNALKNTNIMDIQRMALDNGDYVVYFELKDMNTTDQPLQYRDLIKVDYPKNEVNLSDIMLIDSYKKTEQKNAYSKNGYDFVPYMFDDISEDTKELKYYVEAYNTDKVFGKDNYCAIVTIIENISTNKKVDSVQVVKRIKTSEISSYIGSIDVSSLAEDSYYLTVEIRNGDNILYAYKRHPFYKKSKIKMNIENLDIPSTAFVNLIPDSTLTDNMYYTIPIASEVQKDFIRKNAKTATPSQKRYFLYQFFKDYNPYNPNKAYEQYMSAINYVNSHFKTQIKEGYETDMGRVYLSYGAPDDIIDEKFTASSGFQKRTTIDQQLNPYAPDCDPDGVNYYPYQIWIYHNTPFGESNRKFVFYAKQSNLIEYFLLHSNAKGELQDPYWERTLSRNTLDEGVEGKAGKQFRVGHE